MTSCATMIYRTGPAGRRVAVMTALATRPTTVHFGPNWLAAVMGTGIVANSLAVLHLATPLAGLVWTAATALLIVVTVLVLRARTWHADDPVMTQFWGAPPMALMT